MLFLFLSGLNVLFFIFLTFFFKDLFILKKESEHEGEGQREREKQSPC